MSEVTTAFIGLDVHKDSIAIAVTVPGRAAPRFLGPTGPDFRQRQPRDVPMQCGSQPANIRVIHRRHIASRAAFPVESDS